MYTIVPWSYSWTLCCRYLVKNLLIDVFDNPASFAVVRCSFYDCSHLILVFSYSQDDDDDDDDDDENEGDDDSDDGEELGTAALLGPGTFAV